MTSLTLTRWKVAVWTGLLGIWIILQGGFGLTTAWLKPSVFGSAGDTIGVATLGRVGDPNPATLATVTLMRAGAVIFVGIPADLLLFASWCTFHRRPAARWLVLAATAIAAPFQALAIYVGLAFGAPLGFDLLGDLALANALVFTTRAIWKRSRQWKYLPNPQSEVVPD